MEENSKDIMDIVTAIAFLDHKVPYPSAGLPEEVFYYISRMTPLVNVDLLIKDENGRTLLSWRDDQYAGKGWHIPGGIVRFKETLETRVKKVAQNEIGIGIQFDADPLAVKQCIDSKNNNRGHFVSILYKGFLSGKFIPHNKHLSVTDHGYLRWHDCCPDNLLSWHEMYRKYV